MKLRNGQGDPRRRPHDPARGPGWGGSRAGRRQAAREPHPPHRITPPHACPQYPAPQIIFLLVDDLGWNNVPWNPHSVVKAPHAAALFAEALSMPQCYVQRWCTPTRAALMTGRHPFRNGWNAYGGNQCGKQCADGKCCPGQQGFAEELSSVPLSFVSRRPPPRPFPSKVGQRNWSAVPRQEIMPAMLKRGGYKTHMLGKCAPPRRWPPSSFVALMVELLCRASRAFHAGAHASGPGLR